MKSSRGLLITLAAISFIGSSVGCYTMLKHPRVKIDDRAEAANDNEIIGFADDCSACHSPGSLRAHHPAVPPPRRMVSPAWDYYYDYPWWIPHYTPVVPGGSTPAAEQEQKKRPFDRRHMTRQEETPPPAVSTPAPATSSGTVTKPADSGNSNASEKPQKQDTNKREEKRSGSSQGDRRTRKP
jgi:hypothetical protein